MEREGCVPAESTGMGTCLVEKVATGRAMVGGNDLVVES